MLRSFPAPAFNERTTKEHPSKPVGGARKGTRRNAGFRQKLISPSSLPTLVTRARAPLAAKSVCNTLWKVCEFVGSCGVGRTPLAKTVSTIFRPIFSIATRGHNLEEWCRKYLKKGREKNIFLSKKRKKWWSQSSFSSAMLSAYGSNAFPLDSRIILRSVGARPRKL